MFKKKDKTVYVVSGFMRTGTSMMMKALDKGGMKTVSQKARNKMKDRYADKDYNPNIGGLYELTRENYLKPGFPKKYEGKLLKALNMENKRPTGVGKSFEVMPHGIRVVFMRRDPEEIRQSYNAFFGRQLPEQQIKKLNETLDKCVVRIKNRKDVKSCHVFWFREVIKNPLKHFQILEMAGWPIKPAKCAKVVDSKHVRYKEENLTKGVL